MTNKEAIKILKSKMDGSVDTSYDWCETVRLAVNALGYEEPSMAESEFSPIYPTPNNSDWQYLRGFYDAVNMMMNINSGRDNK